VRWSFARQPGAGHVPVASVAEQAGSEKETWHIDFRSKRLWLDYWSGIPSAFSPAMNLGHVDQIIALLGASHTTEVRAGPCATCCARRCRWRRPPDSCSNCYLHHRRRAARKGPRLAQGEDPDGDAATSM